MEPTQGKPVETLKEGDEVMWASQAGGVCLPKRGKVFAILPPGRTVMTALEMRGFIITKYNLQAIDSLRTSRKVESYIVEVEGKGPKSRPRLYWPLASRLIKVGLTQETKTEEATPIQDQVEAPLEKPHADQ